MASSSSTWYACSPAVQRQHASPVSSTLATAAGPATKTIRRHGSEQRPCRAETNTLHVETLGVDARPNTHHGCQRYQSEPRIIPGQKMCLITFISLDLRIGSTTKLLLIQHPQRMKSLFLHMLHITILSITFLCQFLLRCPWMSFLHQRRNTVWSYFSIFGVFFFCHYSWTGCIFSIVRTGKPGGGLSRSYTPGT